MAGQFQPNASLLRLGLVGAGCLIGGIALICAPRLFPQFQSEIVSSAAFVAGLLICLAGALSLTVALVLRLANVRR